eukprot:352421-Chlamydomonas_euryale.AAC.90
MKRNLRARCLADLLDVLAALADDDADKGAVNEQHQLSAVRRCAPVCAWQSVGLKQPRHDPVQSILGAASGVSRPARRTRMPM